MRNKAKGFPNRISLSGEPRAKEEFASQYANGKTKNCPRERMFESNQVRGRQD
ncbi:MAG TPA: small acid-soluble spore protein K [Bacillales bacterium]|nr:small acid-soluble spore protein K [Bacillales bacterium]